MKNMRRLLLPTTAIAVVLCVVVYIWYARAMTKVGIQSRELAGIGYHPKIRSHFLVPHLYISACPALVLPGQRVSRNEETFVEMTGILSKSSTPLHLNLIGCELSRENWMLITSLRGIESFEAAGSNITDEDVIALSRLPHLSRLRIDHTDVSSVALMSLTNCESLQEIWLYSVSHISDEDISEFFTHRQDLRWNAQRSCPWSWQSPQFF